MRKNRIRLTESQLHRVIKESVKRVLREYDDYNEIDRAWYNIDTPLSHEEEVRDEWNDARHRNKKDGYRRGCNIDSDWDTEDGKLWKKFDMESDFGDAERQGRNKYFGAYYNDNDIYADQNLNVYPNTRFLSKDDQDFKGTPRTSKYFKGRQFDADNNLI